jgi:hypothetical protein
MSRKQDSNSEIILLKKLLVYIAVFVAFYTRLKKVLQFG